MASSSSSALSCLMLLVIGMMFSSSESVLIRVGDKKGYWNIPASPEDYTKWGEKLRLNIGDSLYMEYDGNNDSVLEVNESDYNSCKKDSPIKSYHDGKTTVKLDHSGAYFFISGANGHCEKGQKLAVKVMGSVHHGSHPKAPAPAPVVAPATSPSTDGGDAPAPAPAAAGSRGLKAGIGGALTMVVAGLALF